MLVLPTALVLLLHCSFLCEMSFLGLLDSDYGSEWLFQFQKSVSSFLCNYVGLLSEISWLCFLSSLWIFFSFLCMWLNYDSTPSSFS